MRLSTLLIPMLLLGAASCSQDAPPVSAPTQSSSVTEPVQPEPEPALPVLRIGDVDLSIATQYRVIADRAVARGGTSQRHVFIEATHTSPDELAKAISSAMLQAGLESASVRETDKGIRTVFKGDAGAITVVVRAKLVKGVPVDGDDAAAVAQFVAQS